MLQKASNLSYSIKRFVRYAIVISILLSLSSPVIRHDVTYTQRDGYDISILLDASDSMREDNRFEIAKIMIESFIASRDGDRVALGLFADYAYVSVPLTYYRQTISTMLEYIELGVAGSRNTALYEALYLGSKLFEHSKAKRKIVILLTDGLNTVDTVPLDVALSKAKEQGLKIYTIGIGDDYRRDILKRIALETDGRFFEASEPQALKQIYSDIDTLERSSFEADKSIYHTPLFRYPLILATLLLILYLMMKPRESEYRLYYYVVLILMIVALYGPSIQRETLQSSESSDPLIIGLDLSASMSCSDIYPSRLKVAYHRASEVISSLPYTQIGLLGYATQAYLITPPVDDHSALQLLLHRMDTSHIHREGTHLMEVLRYTQKLLHNQIDKNLLLLTDGGESQSFDREIAYAKEHHIVIYVYNIGTIKGGVIRENKTLLRDSNGAIVITRLNSSIENLAAQTGGEYIVHSSSGDAIQTLTSSIKSAQSHMNDIQKRIQNSIELYYIPLSIALLLLLYIRFHRRRMR